VEVNRGVEGHRGHQATNLHQEEVGEGRPAQNRLVEAEARQSQIRRAGVVALVQPRRSHKLHRNSYPLVQ
jgi:hypothetical protein